MLVNYCKFYSKLFNQRSVLVNPLCASNSLVLFLSLLTSALVQLNP